MGPKDNKKKCKLHDFNRFSCKHIIIINKAEFRNLGLIITLFRCNLLFNFQSFVNAYTSDIKIIKDSFIMNKIMLIKIWKNPKAGNSFEWFRFSLSGLHCGFCSLHSLADLGFLFEWGEKSKNVFIIIFFILWTVVIASS